jgi:hypothetical protein
MDNINPVDSSFGGFLVPLDERRVPLDMLRMQYRFKSFGPFEEAFVEMYGAIDNHVGYAPGVAAGSPWGFPNNGVPSATTYSVIQTPKRTFKDIRGGGKLQWNMFDATFSVAHYYTYFDTPAVQTFVRNHFPATAPSPGDANLASYPNGFSVLAFQTAPLVQVTGATTTFALPSLYTIVRSEFAYFKGEPRFRQEELDPFVYHFYKDGRELNGRELLNGPTTGGRRVGDSINYALGFDINQFIRQLNPGQTFFISTQFFFKHLVHPAKRGPIGGQFGRFVERGEVLPVTAEDVFVPRPETADFEAVEPRLIRQPTNTFLHTLFISTSYRSGTVVPSFTFFYDWGGGLVWQPAITFLHDPFRLSIDYSILAAGTLKGGSGVSLLRDRDNIQFRFEYVI